jgi:hypothetical protein
METGSNFGICELKPRLTKPEVTRGGKCRYQARVFTEIRDPVRITKARLDLKTELPCPWLHRCLSVLMAAVYLPHVGVVSIKHSRFRAFGYFRTGKLPMVKPVHRLFTAANVLRDIES